MVEIGTITGTGLYELEEPKEEARIVKTPDGTAALDIHTLHGRMVGHLSRHYQPPEFEGFLHRFE